ncbi:MAG TPA: DNRLRE domain-containing protein [Solirubrobacteraceae bacterium]
MQTRVRLMLQPRNRHTDPGRPGLRALIVVAVVLAAVGAPVLAAGDTPEGRSLPDARAFEAAQGGEPAPVYPGEGGALGPEIAERRTRASRTYATAEGQYVTRSFTESVNYRDADGDWRGISNTLTDSSRPGYAFRNGANRFTAELPDEFGDDPVVVSRGRASLAFSLAGARGRPAATGPQARVRDALPGVDLQYTVFGDGLKEQLVLESTEAPAVYEFPLTLSAGLTARENDAGGIDVVSASGRRQFIITPPNVLDANGTPGPAVMSLRDGDRPTVILRVDRGWLSDADRKFPVVVDPSVIVTGTQLECHVRNGNQATTNYCNYGELSVGYDTTGHVRRALLKFDVTGVPQAAQVLRAKVALYQFAGDNSTWFDVGLHRVTRAWTTATTWNTYNGANTWTTPGGDFDATVAAKELVNDGVGEFRWYPTQLVQDWVDGDQPNYGMLLKQEANPETVANAVRFYDSTATSHKPFLDVRYEMRTGLIDRYAYDTRRLGDGSTLSVNVGNGNVVLDHQDLELDGNGIDLNIGRTYNSQSQYSHDLGRNWSMSTGRDFFIDWSGDDSAIVYGPTGWAVPSKYLGGGAFTSSAGVYASLRRNADLTFTLTSDDGDEYDFEANTTGTSRLIRVRGADGDTITITYDSYGRLDYIDDSLSRRVDFGGYAGSDPFIASMSTPFDGRSWQYERNGYGDLIRYTSPGGATTLYYYDGYHNLARVRTPDGRDTSLTYDTSDRVTAVIDGLASNSTAPRSTYAYSTPTAPCMASDKAKTVVTNPNSTTTTYCFDATRAVTYPADEVSDQDASAIDQSGPGGSDVTEPAPASATPIDGGGGSGAFAASATTPTETWRAEEVDNDTGLRVLSATAAGTYALTGVVIREDTGAAVSGATVTLSGAVQWLPAADRHLERHRRVCVRQRPHGHLTAPDRASRRVRDLHAEQPRAFVRRDVSSDGRDALVAPDV